MTKMMGRALIAASAILAAVPAAAAPVLFSGNGHYYEYVATNLTWADARAAAASTSYLGLTGYLATVTSAAEDAFLGATFGIPITANDPNGIVGWLGGSDAAVEGEWRWTTGPETGQLFYQGQFPTGTTVTYSNWSPGLPDNEPNPSGGENYLVYRQTGWNDLRATATRGYFIEYSSAVPDVATWMMMIGGFGMIGAILRRRERRFVNA